MRSGEELSESMGFEVALLVAASWKLNANAGGASGDFMKTLGVRSLARRRWRIAARTSPWTALESANRTSCLVG